MLFAGSWKSTVGSKHPPGRPPMLREAIGRSPMTVVLKPHLIQSTPREFIMEFQAKWFTIIYNYVVLVPKWALLFLSGSLASVVIGLMHKGDAKKEEAVAARTVKAEPRGETPAAAGAAKASAASPAAKRESARLRKNGKK